MTQTNYIEWLEDIIKNLKRESYNINLEITRLEHIQRKLKEQFKTQ